MTQERTEMVLERVVIRGIGADDDTYRTEHGYTPEQAAEIREMALMLYKAAWKEAQYDTAKVSASPLVGGEPVSG